MLNKTSFEEFSIFFIYYIIHFKQKYYTKSLLQNLENEFVDIFLQNKMHNKITI